MPAPTGTKMAISVDDLMKVYFSLRTLSSQVMPAQYRTSTSATDTRPEALAWRQVKLEALVPQGAFFCSSLPWGKGAYVSRCRRQRARVTPLEIRPT